MISDQLVALACHINALKKGIETRNFFPQNSTCRFCDQIRFVRPQGDEPASPETVEVIANTPDEWIQWVLSQGYSRAWLIQQQQNRPMLSDRMSAGFAGDGCDWFIATQRGDKADCWRAYWKVWDRKAPENKIWRVEYVLVSDADVTEDLNPPDLKDLSERLSSVLMDIEGFALDQGYAPFADCFAKAQKCLKSYNPFSLAYHKDLAPPGSLSLDAMRLLASCQAAWVFGGMGSWNDISFEGDENQTYESLSNTLFNLINEAICKATNSSAN